MYVLAFVVLAIFGVCFFLESKFTGLYKSYNVYGRVSAYFATACSLGTIFTLVAIIVPPVRNLLGQDMSIGTLLILFLICGGAAALIFFVTLKKCPPELKKKCIPCMIVSGLGVSMKIALFFIPKIWKLTASSLSSGTGGTGFASRYYRDSDGSSCGLYNDCGSYAYLQDPSGNIVEIRPHGGDGLVIDNSGNLYRPY